MDLATNENYFRFSKCKHVENEIWTWKIIGPSNKIERLENLKGFIDALNP